MASSVQVDSRLPREGRIDSVVVIKTPSTSLSRNGVNTTENNALSGTIDAHINSVIETTRLSQKVEQADDLNMKDAEGKNPNLLLLPKDVDPSILAVNEA